jgi:ubiquinone/menaquinone biosynthesis C-methylase UbiE
MTYSDPGTEYLELTPLQTRIDTHRLYSERPEDVEQSVLDAFPLAPDDALLDIGSGTGSFLARLRHRGHQGRLVGLDTSPAAIEALTELGSVEAVQADAARLPFDDRAFAVVTARHMLYHVADPAAVVGEAHRVLASGGWFAATVNFSDALPETDNLLRTVVARYGVTARSKRLLHSGNLPGLIGPVFGEVETTEHRNALVYPTAEAFARYAIAMLSFFGVDHDHPDRRVIVGDLTEEARRRFAESDGPLREPKGFSVSVAQRPA